MLEALGDGKGSVLSLFPICCPQPRRIASTGHSKKPKTKALSVVEKELSEACEEIQNILGGSSLTKKFTAGNLPSTYSTELTPMHTESPFNGISDYASEVSVCSDDVDSSFLSRPKHGKQLFERPVLFESVSALPSMDFSSPETTNHVPVPEPSQTPPVRSHNPLPFNSPFCSKLARDDGIEFGLLSLSPPLVDDEDILSGFETARVRRTMSYYDDDNYERANRNGSSNNDNFTQNDTDSYEFCFV